MTAAVSTLPAADRRQRRLKHVRFLRLALPGLATLLLLAVAGQLGWRAIRLMMIPNASASDTAVRMVNPVFTGESRDGSRYRVAARAGQRDQGDELRIALEAPSVSVERPGGTATRTTAERGVFRQDDMTLRLEGNVQVGDESGNRLTFKTAVFDTRTGRLSGSGVQSRSGTAQVRSDQYVVDEKAGRMVFKGRVRGRIDGQ